MGLARNIDRNSHGVFNVLAILQCVLGLLHFLWLGCMCVCVARLLQLSARVSVECLGCGSKFETPRPRVRWLGPKFRTLETIGQLSVAAKPVACNYGLLATSYGLLWVVGPVILSSLAFRVNLLSYTPPPPAVSTGSAP